MYIYNFNKNIRKLTTIGKFLQEIELAKHKLDVLREEKGDSEVECLDRIRLIDEKHQHDCQVCM
jgi:hypothetical protein